MTGPLVIVGDSMLDVDIEGSARRLSPEAPVPVVDADRMWRRPGGAGLAAVLAARSEPDVVLVTALADDEHGRTLAELLAGAGVQVVALPMLGTTLCKIRIRAGGQSVVRLDTGDGAVAPGPLPAEAIAAIAGARAVCVADYGNGITAHTGMRTLLADTAGRIPLIWDPHPRGVEPVPDVALVTPNEVEAQHFCGRRTHGKSADLLVEQWQARAVCVTLGARGALLGTRWKGTRFVPAPPGIAGRADACGAGDRFTVAVAAAMGSGCDVVAAVETAVDSASRFVAAGGAAAVSEPAPLSAVSATPAGEIPVGTDVEEVSRRLRRRGGRVVAAGGCFDLLHTGHIRLLRQARDLGDALVVLLNSDDSVRRLKGPDRPVVAAADRARVLAALACVDAVCVFDEPSPEAALERLRPDVWVKGGDYRAEDLPEAEVVSRHGGDVVILPTVAGYSSSRLIAAARSTAGSGA